jgi:glycerate-2-kinase
VEILQHGRDGTIEDSPSSEHPVFETSRTVLVGNNAIAVEAAARTAQSLGYNPVILGTEIEGEAKEVAQFYTSMARYLQKQSAHGDLATPAFAVSSTLPVALIAGGETTVTLTPDSGRGGRNQELALAAAIQLESLGLRNIVLASAGTDGGDGPTDAAGAVVDGTTICGSRSEALKALSKHDSYHYFGSLKQVGQDSTPLIKTGPTGTVR